MLKNSTPTSNWQPTKSKQQTTNSKQQTANSKQQTTATSERWQKKETSSQRKALVPKENSWCACWNLELLLTTLVLLHRFCMLLFLSWKLGFQTESWWQGAFEGCCCNQNWSLVSKDHFQCVKKCQSCSGTCLVLLHHLLQIAVP